MKTFSIFTETNYSFEGQRPYERVVVLLHRHWFVIALRIIGFVVMAFVPLAIYLVLINYSIFAYFQSFYTILVAAFYLFWWYAFFYSITMYLLDIWIITNHRVIDSEQHGFFKRDLAELSLAKIQDVSTEVNGFMATWLRYGNLDIQSAGPNPKFSFKQIPNPLEVQDKLMRAHNEYITEHPGGLEVHEGL